MSFKFNFVVPVRESPSESHPAADDALVHQSNRGSATQRTEEIEVAECHYVRTKEYLESLAHCSKNSGDVISDYTGCVLRNDDLQLKNIKHFPSLIIEEQLKKELEKGNEVLQAIESHLDLISGEYEGGLKVWECTFDLIGHLMQENIVLKNKKVLELGCGHGLLGIFALCGGAVVHFQDYNREVIHLITIPNVIFNEQKTEQCRFFAGDWTSLSKILGNIDESEKYDMILTSETIYNQSNYIALVSVLRHCLKRDGVVYLAAKSVYFGVGGSVKLFTAYVDSLQKFKVEPCLAFTEDLC